MREKFFIYKKGVRLNSFDLSKTKNLKEKNSRIKRIYSQSFFSPFKNNAPKNLIILYDIPEGKKKERDWFRRQLIKFNYLMIQKSVWVGPSPLPKEFLDYLKAIKIGDNFKTFKLAKPYNNKNKII